MSRPVTGDLPRIPRDLRRPNMPRNAQLASVSPFSGLTGISHQSNTSPKRKRGLDTGLPSLALRASVERSVPDSPRVGRVERWRGGVGFGIIPCRGFPVRVSIAACHAPFPPPAHRTGRADFPHPALGQGFTLSPTESCAFAAEAEPAPASVQGIRPGSVTFPGLESCA